jgi:hypothetical protein
MAGSLASQLLDPCRSEMISFPDQFNGKVEFVNCVTTAVVASQSTHRMIVINPTSDAKIAVSAATWSATFNGVGSTDDTTYDTIINSGSYKYIRPISYCVRVTKASAATTDNGKLRVACAPISTGAVFSYPANWTAGNLLMDTNDCVLADIEEGFEIAWCPRAQDNFVPFVPDSNIATGLDIKGSPLAYRPSILLLWDGITGTASTLNIEVTTRYECFLAPTYQSRGIRSHHQDQSAIDMFMSAVPQMCFLKQGSLAYKAAEYAAKVGGVLAGGGFGAIASKAVSKVTC